MNDRFSDSTELSTDDAHSREVTTSGRKRVWTRCIILIRRIHLYTGLFLLPWGFLYGITGAMYNHQWLLPEAEFRPVERSIVSQSAMSKFPSAEELATQVVQSIQAQEPNADITLAPDSSAEFTNPLMFEMWHNGRRHVVQIDPVDLSAELVTHPERTEQLEPLLADIRNLSLSPDPHEYARTAAKTIFNESGMQTRARPQPVGWTKLNFLAHLDGEPVRVTYVLKDGHVDITRFTGEDGMSPRHFFLRLHTTHGQSPHWNGRSLWSLVVDVMALAMVCWGLSGFLMWWQIKRTRILGTIIVLTSVATAAWLYWTMIDFYATTKL